MNLLLIALRDWGWRNLSRHPLRSALALLTVTAISALSWSLWLRDLVATSPGV